jgi:hypothetical protein
VCAITGGAFYNPSTASFGPEYVGAYFFLDYCAGWVKYLTFPNGPDGAPVVNTMATGLTAPFADFLVGLAVGPGGQVHYLKYGTGVVRRLQLVSPAPSIVSNPRSVTGTTRGAVDACARAAPPPPPTHTHLAGLPATFCYLLPTLALSVCVHACA